MNNAFNRLFKKKLLLAPRTSIVLEGQQNNRMYFIKEGSIRFWYTHEQKEITTQLLFDGESFTSIESFFFNEPSNYSIETMEACELTYITKDEFDSFLKKKKAEIKDEIYQSFIRQIVINSRRMSFLLKTKPEQRFYELLNSQPDILDRIPQNIVASYLGITNVSLSRIKNRVKTEDLAVV